LSLLEERRDLLDEPRLRHLIGNFRDDDLVGAAAQILRLPARAQAEAAATRLISLANDIARLHQHAARREIGSGHERHQLLDAAALVLHEMRQRVAELA